MPCPSQRAQHFQQNKKRLCENNRHSVRGNYVLFKSENAAPLQTPERFFRAVRTGLSPSSAPSLVQKKSSGKGFPELSLLGSSTDEKG